MEVTEQTLQNQPSFHIDQLQWKLELRFPSYSYAEAAMNTIAVDSPFQDTKNKKTSIKRNMEIVKQDQINEYAPVILVIIFTSDEEEVNSLRTCVTSFIGNLTLVCQTMKELGN